MTEQVKAHEQIGSITGHAGGEDTPCHEKHSSSALKGRAFSGSCARLCAAALLCALIMAWTGISNAANIGNPVFINYDTTWLWSNPTASGAWSFAIGQGAEANGNHSFAIGANSYIQRGSNNIAIGYEAKVLSNQSGFSETVEAIAFGYQALVDYGGDMAFGRNATSTEVRAVAIGSGANATGREAMALGYEANAAAEKAMALGYKANAAGEYSTAIGYQAEATLEKSTAIGYKAKTTAGGGLAIGETSLANRAGGVAGWAPEGFTPPDNSTWKATTGAVSVGNDTAGSIRTRQITGVAAGTNDTDAANVAQLKSLKTFIDGYNTQFKLNADAGAAQIVTMTKTTTPEIKFEGESGKIVTTVGKAGEVTTVTIKADPALVSTIGSALQSWDAQIDGNKVKTVNKADNALNFKAGSNIKLSDDSKAIKVSVVDAPTFAGKVTAQEGFDAAKTRSSTSATARKPPTR